MPLTKAAEKLQDGSQRLEKLMIITLIISILLFFITNGPMPLRYMFIMARSLQLTFHLPMIKVIFPSNVMMMIRIIIPVIGFDVLESALDWETINEFFNVFQFSDH